MRIVLLMEDGFLCIRGMERAGKEKQTSQSIFFKVLYKTNSMLYCEEGNWGEVSLSSTVSVKCLISF